MIVPQEILDELVAHAREEAPDECCGMLGAIDGCVTSLHRAENLHHSPLRYEIAGPDQFRIMDAIESAGEELGAIYHSHTRSPPVPSQTDVNLASFGPDRLARFPGTLYVIVGVHGPEPEVRAWRIDASGFIEVGLDVD